MILLIRDADLQRNCRQIEVPIVGYARGVGGGRAGGWVEKERERRTGGREGDVRV